MGISLQLQEALEQPRASPLASGLAQAGPRVAIVAPPGPEYVCATWASWLSGCIPVPLAPSHTSREKAHILRDAGVSMVYGSYRNGRRCITGNFDIGNHLKWNSTEQNTLSSLCA